MEGGGEVEVLKEEMKRLLIRRNDTKVVRKGNAVPSRGKMRVRTAREGRRRGTVEARERGGRRLGTDFLPLRLPLLIPYQWLLLFHLRSLVVQSEEVRAEVFRVVVEDEAMGVEVGVEVVDEEVREETRGKVHLLSRERR